MKKFLGFICLAYSFIIAYLWIFNQLKNFLAPTMQIYIKVSLIPLIIVGFVLYYSEHIHYKFKIRAFILFTRFILGIGLFMLDTGLFILFKGTILFTLFILFN